MNELLSGTKSTSAKRMCYLMGGLIKIETTSESHEQALEAIQAAFSEMKRIEKLLSRFLPGSAVSLINQNAAIKPVKVSDEIFSLLSTCQRLSALSDGAFDITSLPFTELWQQAEQHQKLPHGLEIEQVKKQVGYKKMILNDSARTVFFSRPGMKIDLGAVGKGYAIDGAVNVLRRAGIKSGIIDAGSTIFSIGDKSQFAIAHPFEPNKIVAVVSLLQSSLSTSGVCERFWIIRGKKYGHLIDPRTGVPVQGCVLSVSTVQAAALLSDVLSTAALILGEKKGGSLLHKMNSQEAVVVASHQIKPFLVIRRFVGQLPN